MDVGGPADAPVFDIWRMAATIRTADESLRHLASSGQFNYKASIVLAAELIQPGWSRTAEWYCGQGG